MKTFRVILMVLVAVVLAAGTVFEKYRGAEWVASHFYGSWWFAVLMGVVALGAIVAIVQGKMWRRPSALLVHAAVPVILLGGALTTWTGLHGSMTLQPGLACNEFDGHKLPFSITLESFDVVPYPGTHTPMDFVSHVTVADESTASSETISMNNILRRDGYRFYQEDYDDEGRSVLSVSHDPWGITVTYCGYALLLLGMLGLMLSPYGRFRKLLKGAAVAAILMLPLVANAAPRTLPCSTASKMGEMYVLYKGRICPLQTYAKDFTTKLTGKSSYEGLTSEQVLGGFLFYYDEWAPMLDNVSEKRKKESEGLVKMLVSGHGLKIFPLTDGMGTIGWYAQNDELPVNVSEDEYIFIRKQQSYCQELVVKGDYEELERVFDKIRQFQEKRAASVLPSPIRVRAERLYNALTTGRWLPMLSITLGLLMFAYSLFRMGRGKALPRVLHGLSVTWVALLTVFLILIFVLRWIAGGHIPMAGGFDSMNLMAIAIGLIGLLLPLGLLKRSDNRKINLIPAAMLTMGFCLLVAMMSGSNPPVTNLMPVLSSPLLCLHVAVIMMSYALFFFLMMIGIAGLIIGKKNTDFQYSIFNLAKRLLYPAVFLLTLGIIIGALWANISWGNYWSWDPKEVWALITLIVYAFPLHSSLAISHKPRAFFLYCTLAFLSVIITYFGVNLLLGGMHAYN